MYCSTCGSKVADGRSECGTCGARVSPAPTQLARMPTALDVLGLCPRCAYRGPGAMYFSRTGHVVAGVALAAMTAGALGLGGIAYYMMRKDHVVCPRCGNGWGKHGMRGMALASALGGGRTDLAPMPVMRPGTSGKTVASWILWVFGAIMMAIGIGEAELIPALFAMIAGGGGFALHQAAKSDREARREALLSSLQLPVLKLAGEKGGRLTVTDVASELGWTMPRAEKVLNSLDDGMRVNSEVTDEGVIVYEFRELQSRRPSLPPVDGGSGYAEHRAQA